jgi:hypothetical protein
MKLEKFMNKLLGFIISLSFVETCSAASVEQYVSSVEKITATYAQDIRGFLRSLDPKLSQFSPEQKVKYCDINNQYIQNLSDAIEKNRTHLPAPYATMTKQHSLTNVHLFALQLPTKRYKFT